MIFDFIIQNFKNKSKYSFWGSNWQLLYLALAAIGIFSLSLILFLSYLNLSKYENALELTSKKNNVQDHFSKLAYSAQKVNAPGNDIFYSKNLALEKKNFAVAKQEFEASFRQFENIFNDSLDMHLATEKGPIDRIKKSMALMSEVTEKIFDSYDKKQTQTAASYMAEMDRHYAVIILEIESVASVIRESINQSLNSHHADLMSYKEVTLYFSALLVILILGLTFFGRRQSIFVKEQIFNANRTREVLSTVSVAALVDITDSSGKIIEVNDNFCQLSGYSRDEFIGNDHRIVNSGMHSKEFFKDLWKTVSSGKIWYGDIQNRKKNGEVFVVKTLISPLKNAKGQIDHFMSIRFDISTQKLLEAEFLEAQKIAKIGSWSFNLLTKLQKWSSENYRIFEIQEPQSQEVLHKLYRERIHPDDLSMLDTVIERALKYGEDFVYNHRIVLDGGKRIKYAQGIGKVIRNKLGEPISITGTCQDLTDYRSFDIENSTTLATMSEGLVIQGESGAIQKFNNTALKLLGLTEDQLLGRTSMDPRWKATKQDGSPYLGEDHPAMVALKTNLPVNNKIMGLTIPINEERWIQINAVPFQSSLERKVVVTFTDITTIIKKQKELTALKEQNELVLKSTGVGIWKFNVVTKQLEWDKSLYSLYELDPNDFSGDYNAWESTLSPEAKQKAVTELELAINGEKEFNTTFEITTKQGKRKYIGGRGVVIRNSQNEPLMMYGVNWDKTREVILERNLEFERSKSIQNAKLAALGEMAAGIAHEINNPLSIVAGNAHILHKYVDNKEALMAKIETIVKSTNRIEKIVGGLKKFSRSSSKTEFKVENLKDILSEVLILTETKAKRHATVMKVDIADDLKIYCDQVEIEQVLINLINNGIDALKSSQVREISIKSFADLNHVVIQIIDSGEGIDAQLEEKLFQPFFTTKPSGEGTGLGLSIAKGILDNHNATIKLNREIKNTCFELRFPKADSLVVNNAV
jgi:PAS domain S-box-containing protein